MQAAQRIVQSIQPNLISFAEYNQFYKQSLDLQVDDKKKEEMQDIHREIVKANLQTILKQSKARRSKTSKA